MNTPRLGNWPEPLKYLDVKKEDMVDRPMRHHSAGLSFTATGYGNAIPNRQMVRIGTRLHRIYTTIHSNVGTSWVIVKGERLIVREID